MTKHSPALHAQFGGSAHGNCGLPGCDRGPKRQDELTDTLAELIAEHPKPHYLHPHCRCGANVSAAETVGETLTSLWETHLASVLANAIRGRA